VPQSQLFIPVIWKEQVVLVVGAAFSHEIKGMNPRASSGLKRELASLAPFTPQQSCEEFFD
jgi:hypothetical protein